MAHSLGSDAYFQRHKDQHHRSYHDSGYTVDSPRKFDSFKSFGFDEPHETPKENISQKRELSWSLTPKKDRHKEHVRCPERDLKKEQSLQNGWCETPKVSKSNGLLRRRLMCKSTTDGKTENSKTPCMKRMDFSAIAQSEHRSNAFFDSPDSILSGALATSTLKPEDLLLSNRKRRLMFSHVKTSTLEDGKCNVTDLPVFERKASVSLSDADLDESIISSDHLATGMLETPCYSKFMPSVKENFQTPVNDVAAYRSESLNVLSTPSFTPTPKHERYASEDSGFSSLALDKSQDSSVDYDSSFQELFLPSTSKSRETPKQAEMRRRARLERQRRLSTLKEGGSQSEEDVRNAKAGHRDKNMTGKGQRILSKEDEVFLEVTPLRTTTAKLEDLSLTPALQMLHAMCLRSARMWPEQTSLDELLKATVKPEPFRTTMPLAGLIGRKVGLEKVDISTELKKRNLRHILAMILNQLSPEDVYRFGQVSNSWNEIILQDKMATRRRRLYLKEAKAALELGSAVHVPDAETRLCLLSRSALRSVQAQSKTPGTCTPQSGKSTLTPTQHSGSKRDEFLLVAKTLFNDECLKACPLCKRPGRCRPMKREGVCSNPDCAFQFCTACLCAFHGSKECGSQSASRRSKKDVLPGSAQSKRNVRRL